MSLKTKEEVKKQFDVGFLVVARYPKWVANIMSVPKKDGKVRMFMDYRDLNRASSKHNFPLLHFDVLIDNTTNFALFSFMDGVSGYNQIKMAPENMENVNVCIHDFDDAKDKGFSSLIQVKNSEIQKITPKSHNSSENNS